uniref:Uncharacterized protein n=1 Tax=Hyaloperonospora arabidopsidis (strain Emoy2) TaxID=559515 RepID=M4B2Z2_HYAAE
MESSSTLTPYVQQLQTCLQWNPTKNDDGIEKQRFVEALTNIAALPLDSISMEIRRLLVVSRFDARRQQSSLNREETIKVAGNNARKVHLDNLIAALNARDVLLKCKAANAVGSLSISRVAGQQLLDLYGDEIFQSVAKMATRKNQWVQGDAFFVLGWMVVIADDAMLTTIADLVPTVIKCLRRNINLPVEVESLADGNDEMRGGARARRSKEIASSERESNLRIYALVLLVNFSQRRVAVFETQLERLLPMLKDLVVELLEPISSAATNNESADGSETADYDAVEYAEVSRLAITLLSVLVDQLGNVASQLLELKVLPHLLKLKRVLHAAEFQELLGGDGSQDIAERLDAIVEILVHHR